MNIFDRFITRVYVSNDVYEELPVNKEEAQKYDEYLKRVNAKTINLK
mgnify:FL=1